MWISLATGSRERSGALSPHQLGLSGRDRHFWLKVPQKGRRSMVNECQVQGWGTGVPG